MPLLKFYINPGQLTKAEKAELAGVLTARYATFMPAFFVNVVFHEVPEESFFVGGVPTARNFVRLTLEHIYLNFAVVPDGAAIAQRYLDFIGELFRERFEKRGWRWEYSITETDINLWRIQGLAPPPMGSDAMKYWAKEEKGVEWKGNFEGNGEQKQSGKL